MNKLNEKDIQDWLAEEGIFRQKVPDDGAEFHFTIEYPKNNIMDVIQPKGKKDLILIVCGTQVSPEHIELMKEASESQKEEFIYEIKFKINELETDFQMDVTQDYILKQFVIQDGIYEDALTKNNLMRSIKHIFRTKMSVVWLMEKKFGVVQMSSDNNSPSTDNIMFM